MNKIIVSSLIEMANELDGLGLTVFADKVTEVAKEVDAQNEDDLDKEEIRLNEEEIANQSNQFNITQRKQNLEERRKQKQQQLQLQKQQLTPQLPTMPSL